MWGEIVALGTEKEKGVSGLHLIWCRSRRDEAFGQIGRQASEINGSVGDRERERKRWGQGKRVCGCGSVWGKRGFKGSNAPDGAGSKEKS